MVAEWGALRGRAGRSNGTQNWRDPQRIWHTLWRGACGARDACRVCVRGGHASQADGETYVSCRKGKPPLPTGLGLGSQRTLNTHPTLHPTAAAAPRQATAWPPWGRRPNPPPPLPACTYHHVSPPPFYPGLAHVNQFHPKTSNSNQARHVRRAGARGRPGLGLFTSYSFSSPAVGGRRGRPRLGQIHPDA